MGATDPAKADAGTLRKEFAAVDRAQRDARIRRAGHGGLRNRLLFRRQSIWCNRPTRRRIAWAGRSWSVAGLVAGGRLGLLIMLGVPLGRLPGDFYVRRGNFTSTFRSRPRSSLSIILTLLRSPSSVADHEPSNPIAGSSAWRASTG